MPMRWPDCARPDAKRAQESSKFALIELAWGAIVVRTPPILPKAVLQFKQHLDQRRTKNAVYTQAIKYVADVAEQHDAGVFLQAPLTKSDGCRSRSFPMAKIVGNGQQHAPIVGRAIVKPIRHLRGAGE
jgi:hypothetical protein